jgi:hypothetical protein
VVVELHEHVTVLRGGESDRVVHVLSSFWVG